MADAKITALPVHTSIIDTDVLPIVDITNDITKKTTWSTMKSTLKTYFDTLYGNGGGGTWGSITGTLSSQTDLQTALDNRFKLGGNSAGADVSLGTDDNFNLLLRANATDLWELKPNGHLYGLLPAGSGAQYVRFGTLAFFGGGDYNGAFLGFGTVSIGIGTSSIAFSNGGYGVTAVVDNAGNTQLGGVNYPQYGSTSIGKGSMADASAILEVGSSATTNPRGMLLPRLTTTQRDAIASPANSLLIFNITTNQFEWCNAGTWTAL